MSDKIKMKHDPKAQFIAGFSAFEAGLNGERARPIQDMRKQAIAKFAELEFPTTRQEDWKYTNISPLLKHTFKPVLGMAGALPDISKLTFTGLERNLLVFVNGKFSPALSTFENRRDGLVISSLAQAFDAHQELVAEHFGKSVSFDENAFTALNTAFAQDGVFLYVPDGAVMASPLHILYVANPGSEPVHMHPRNLIIVGKHAQAQIIESYASFSDAPYFTNVVTEIAVAEEASVKHVRLQVESEQGFHLNRTQVQQSGRSVYTIVAVDLGAALARNDTNIALAGEHCESHLIGFYFGHGTQLIDNHTFIDHAMPNCDSNELYRGILDGKAHGVFNGKVLVRKDAQKTNAYQSNQGILLTQDAVLDSKPQLEIFADDVKCSHGATIGELDEDALFYLRARGIGEERAHYMLRLAFASDVFNQIEHEAVRTEIENMVIRRFEQASKR